MVANTAGVSTLKAAQVVSNTEKAAMSAKKVSSSTSKVTAKQISEQVESSLVKAEKKALQTIKSNPKGPELTDTVPNSVLNDKTIQDSRW